jgi:Zn-dependent protease
MAQPASDSVTRDTREILERAAEIARARSATESTPVDVLRATLQLPGSLADGEIRALGVDPKVIESSLTADGVAQPPLKQLLINANREAQVLGHYRVDSIHLLLAMLYSDSPATAGPLQKAGVTLYDLRRHLQTGTHAGVPAYQDPTQRDRGLRRLPWPSLRGVLGISPVFLGLLGLTAVAGALLWTNLVPGLVTVLTILFVVGFWVASLCLHEFGHSIVAYLGGDRSVASAGYLSLNPLRYANVAMSLVLPVIFLLLGGVALPGGAVYINHSSLRTRAWSAAVSLAGPVANALCATLVAAVFFVAPQLGWMTAESGNFFAALALVGFFQILAVLLNLLPVPGIDGFGIIRPWLPYNVQYAAMRYGMLAIYGVFLALWFVAPVRAAFYGAVFSLVSLAGIPDVLVFIGQLNMRFM